MNKKDFKQSWMREKKELWKNKRMHGQFVRQMPETTDKKETCNWMRKAVLKVETEAMLCTMQEQPIRTSYVKHKIDKTAQLTFYRMCDTKSETIFHIISNMKSLHKRSTREGTIMLQK